MRFTELQISLDRSVKAKQELQEQFIIKALLLN